MNKPVLYFMKMVPITHIVYAAGLLFTFILLLQFSYLNNLSSISGSLHNHPSIAKDQQILTLQAQLAQMKLVAKKLGVTIDVSSDIPKIYVITPTHKRPQQKAELIRLSHTLMLVPNLHWIVIEDSTYRRSLVEKLLYKSGLSFTHLHVLTPAENRKNKKMPRGVLQRNAGLDWIRNNVKDDNGVVYFADDDNTYSLELFEEIRSVKSVGVWPVGLAGGLFVERPKVTQQGEVVGWLVGYAPERKFAIDMAGFAVNLKLIMRNEAKFSFTIGRLETRFLEQCGTTLKLLEAKASKCTEVLVWHTRTQSPYIGLEHKFKLKYKHPSNVGIEV